MPLTDEQKAAIEEIALEVVYEDASANADYKFAIVRDWVKAKTPLEQAEAVSTDRTLWPEYWSFDPETGEPWSEEEGGA